MSQPAADNDLQLQSGEPSSYVVRTGNGTVRVMDCGLHDLERDAQLVCRTVRGIEMVTVLAKSRVPSLPNETRIKFLRRSRPEDDLLWKQLRSLSALAANDCQRFLDERGLDDVLVDVEPLLDGKTVYFHFLGEPSAEIEGHVQELADVYQKKVATSKFAKLLEAGCGPDCGTNLKGGCGTSGGCAVCAVAGRCVSK
jgi:hypothetical protein